MTLDDLEQIYDRAKADQHNSGKRAGIRAVVEALRDEIVNKNSRCGWCLTDGALDHVNDIINEILASDEVKP